MSEPISRRRLVRALGVGAGLAMIAPLLQACQSSAPASPTAAPAASQSGAAPTAASAAAPTTASQPSQSSSSAPAPTAAASTGSAAQKVTLEIYTNSGSQWAGWMDQAYKDDVAGWKSKNPNIIPHVNGVAGWTDQYFPKIFTLVSTGAKFDVLWYPPRHRSHIAWGTRYKIVRSLNDLMKANNFDPQKNFLPGAIQSSSWDGQLYWFSYTGEPSVPIIAYNKTQIEKLGMSVPPDSKSTTGNWTFDDMNAWAKEATKSGFFGYSKGDHGGNPIGEIPELRQWGIELADSTGKKVVMPEKNMVDWLQYRWNLIWQWKVSPQSGSNPSDLFVAGKLLAYPTWPVNLNRLPKILVKDKFEIAFRLTPVVNKGDKLRSMLNEHVNGVAESRFCDHPEQAFNYLSWISSDEFALQGIVAGIGATIARQDFWSDDRLYKFSPQEEYLKELMLNIEPDILVANWRGEQFDTAFQNDYQKLELNKLNATQAYTNLMKDCQAVMNLTPA